jgi:hypothetical protein
MSRMANMAWRMAVICSITVALPHVALAQAQSEATVSDVVTFLLTNQAVATGDFEKDRAAAVAARDSLAEALSVALATTPMASSSGGFAYRFNSELGTVERVSETFGPAFVERALVPPAGRFSVAVSFRDMRFNELDGLPLGEGSGILTVANRFRDEPAPFDQETLALNLRASTVTVTASGGVGGRVEIGAAVPFVRLHLDGARTNVYRGQTFIQASGDATAAGLGDIALRVKFQPIAIAAGGVSVGADLRLPTGREEDFLGAGEYTLRLLLIGSAESGPLALHANGSITRGGAAEGFGGATAISVAVNSRVTVSGEMLIDRLNALHQIGTALSSHPTIAGVETTRLTSEAGAGTRVLAVAGVRWNFSGPWLLGGQVLWPITERGLSARPSPILAIERAW